jgi:Cytochrome P460
MWTPKKRESAVNIQAIQRARPARTGVAALLVCGVLAGLELLTTSPAAQSRPSEGPTYLASGQLMRPTNYREWVYVTSGLGMTYGSPEAAAARKPMFDNVFVTPDAYREFMRSGTWPEKTMFVLEVRNADTNVSINNGGHTQGTLAGVEASVKDRQRFPEGGWGYFSFRGQNGLADSAAPFPQTASCYSCHGANTAVDNTFVQFYPTLFEVARRLGTVKSTYDPARKP